MNVAEAYEEAQRLNRLLDAGIEAIRTQAVALAEAENAYRKARAHAWMHVPKDGSKEWTAGRREAQVDADPADLRMARDIAEGVQRAAIEAVRDGAGPMTAQHLEVYEPPTITYPTVVQAFAAVMAEVQSVGKDGTNTSQNYNFRGIDGVMNAVGPALRKHGVVIVPRLVSANYRDIEVGKNRTLMREVTVEVEYLIHGPAGDVIVGSAPGESMDSGDKGTAKAMSVAYRTFLLQALTIPTHQPDPDEHSYERSEAVYEDPAAPGLRTALQGAIDKLSDPEKQALKAFFAENQLPPVRVMNAQQASMVIDHLLETEVVPGEVPSGSASGNPGTTEDSGNPDPSQVMDQQVAESELGQ